jgi:hypothetical protein
MIENERQSDDLTPKHWRAIECLMAEPTTRAAARRAGIGEATLRRWLGDAAFTLAYQDARNRQLETTLTNLQAASGQAVQTLRDVMGDDTAKPSERVSAAKAVLEISLKARDILETEERLSAIERRLEVQQTKGMRR